MVETGSASYVDANFQTNHHNTLHNYDILAEANATAQEAWSSYESSETEQKTPYAFNLSNEYMHIQHFGDTYRPFFIKQVEYYLKETYGKVPVVTYGHSIKNGELYIDAIAQTAKASYEKPILDTTLPNWYRKRAQADYEVITELEAFANSAKSGEIFIDLSPAPTEEDAPPNELKKWAFGKHGFIRASQVVETSTNKTLLTRAYRHYLDSPEEARVLENLTGKKVDKKNLMGAYGLVSRDLAITSINDPSIQILIDHLYKTTPPERKIVPEHDDNFFASNQEVEYHLEVLRPWVEEVFSLMKNGPPLDSADSAYLERITQEFQGIESAIKNFLNNKAEPYKEFKSSSLSSTPWETTLSIDLDQLRAHYIREKYTAEANSCGSGSGFEKVKVIQGVQDIKEPLRAVLSGLMDHKNLTETFDGLMKGKVFDTIYPDFPCSKCGNLIMANHGITNCKGCGITKEEYAKEKGQKMCA